MRERVINRAGIWAGLAALTAALLLAVALSPQAAAQDSPPAPPHWFFGVGFDSDNGATIRALNQDGEQVESTTISDGSWSLIVDLADADSVTFEIGSGSSRRVTEESYTLPQGRLTEVERSAFTVVAAPVVEEPEPEAPTSTTIAVQVRARLAPNGKIEFGARRADGEDVLPRGRFLPTSVVDGRITPEERITHGRWLRSSLIDLGDGYTVQVIARVKPDERADAEPGSYRIEFGLYVDGVDAAIGEYNSGDAEPMFLPRGRYFPATISHNRWLSSNPPTDIPQAP